MRVAVVAGLCTHHDAISSAVEDQVRVLGKLCSVDSVSAFGQHIHRTLPCPSYELQSPGRLLDHPEFSSADVAIFHWGIRYELFNAIAMAQVGGPAIAVHFHNCTPENLVPAHSRRLAHESLLQGQLMARDDLRVWTYSEFNRATLRSWGVDDSRIDTVPFRIEAPRPTESRRHADTFDIASVGRYVPAKGQLTLVEAIPHLPDELRGITRVRFAGNTKFSDADYISLLQERAFELGIREQVQFLGQPDDELLWRLYESSHVLVSTSYHEGLCVPIIEGYIAGCSAIGTTEGNLPHVVQSPGHIVPPGDPGALAEAIEGVANELRNGQPEAPARGVGELIALHGGPNVERSLEAALRATARDSADVRTAS